MAHAVEHPERFVGMHFFNPVEKMPLVEIIRGEKTSEATIDRKGRKNGRGFYDYSGKKHLPWDGLTKTLELPTTPKTKLSREQITDRLVLHLVNEAMKCLNQGVAGSDKTLAEKQIDLGTVMGIGFPPFRGGVLYYAKMRGLEQIHAELGRLHQGHGVRYAPW